jgi:hypothetical protein
MLLVGEVVPAVLGLDIDLGQFPLAERIGLAPLETARLLGVGVVEPFAPLDSFFSDAAAGPERTAAVAGHLQEIGARTYVMVTHQVNITALTGIFPASGEMIVVKPDAANPGRPTVVGRIR